MSRYKLGLLSVAILVVLSIVGVQATFWTQRVAVEQGQDHRHGEGESIAPLRVQGVGEVQAEIVAGQGAELWIDTNDGVNAMVYFGPSSFIEDVQFTARFYEEPDQSFFVTARGQLNIESTALALSPIVSIAPLDVTESIHSEMMRFTLPIKEEWRGRLDEFELMAVFSRPLTSGGITTTTIEKIEIDYPVTDFVTFWGRGVPAKALLIGRPK